jgi:hypothetical protein
LIFSGATVQSVLYILLVDGAIVNQTEYDYNMVIDSLSTDVILCTSGYPYASQFTILTQNAICEYSITWYVFFFLFSSCLFRPISNHIFVSTSIENFLINQYRKYKNLNETDVVEVFIPKDAMEEFIANPGSSQM